jgi:hypothetical protein
MSGGLNNQRSTRPKPHGGYLGVPPPPPPPAPSSMPANGDGAMMTLATGRQCTSWNYGLMFDIVAGDRPLLVHALHAQSDIGDTVSVATRTVAGGWQANQESA